MYNTQIMRNLEHANKYSAVKQLWLGKYPRQHTIQHQALAKIILSIRNDI